MRKFKTNMITQGFNRDCSKERVWTCLIHSTLSSLSSKESWKIIVVFDSRKNNLGSHLFQGSNHEDSLIGVLLRYRQEEVAFACDISAMYHQSILNS